MLAKLRIGLSFGVFLGEDFVLNIFSNSVNSSFL